MRYYRSDYTNCGPDELTEDVSMEIYVELLITVTILQ